MPTIHSFLRFFLIFIVFLCSSCVKDVDLNQVDEVVIPPTAAIDLVYFTLVQENFVKDENSILTAEDAVRLEFLDDDYIQTGLMNAEFTFKYQNSFQKDLISTVSFLSKNKAIKYAFSFPIPAGDSLNPKSIYYTEIISANRIQAIRDSFIMKVEIKMLSNSNPVEGSLQLKSKGFYNFEF